MSLLLRIFLVLATLAGFGAAYIGYTTKQELVKEQGVTKKLTADLASETSLRKKTQDQLKETEGTLAKTKSELTETSSQLESTKSQLADAEAKKRQAESSLAANQQKLKDAESQLENIMKQLPPGTTIEQVQARVKELQEQVTTFEQEKKVLQEQVAKAESERKRLADLLDRREKGQMAPGTTGHILAVNSDWNFVVLDIGRDQGVLENAQMIVYRNGTLIGKVKISSVDKSIAVADVLPEWKQADIREGDTVVF